METAKGQGGQLIVLAEEPSADRVEDWLSPPLSPQQAALAAEAALADTLAVVAAAPAARRVIALDGAPGDWLPDGFRVIGQRGGGLDERLAAAFADAYAIAPLPMVLIGTDTPQVTADVLGDAVASLESGEADAVFGPSADGGFWLIGLRRPDRSLLAGVSAPGRDPGRALLDRLAGAGLRVALAPRLTEVNSLETAVLVAGQVPGSRFAAAVAASAATVAESAAGRSAA